MNIHSVHKQHKLPSLGLALLVILALACLCNAPEAALPTQAPTYTPYPTYTPVPTEAPPTEAAGPSLNITQNANCRSGPGTAFGIADTLYQGQTVPILGRNEDNTWFEVKKPSGDGFCWVSSVSVTAQGDLNAVLVVSVQNPPDNPSAKPKKTPTLTMLEGEVKIKPTKAILEGEVKIKPTIPPTESILNLYKP
jgi:uncharacterized protein YgiM (DUF1202 family)